MGADVICPYCKAKATLTNSSKIYGKDYGNVWLCINYPSCDSWVGVHKANDKPLGILANAELRKWKKKAHDCFDNLWKRKLMKRKAIKGEKYKKKYARGSGYKWLAVQLGIDRKECHIGMFDVELCKRVVEICQPYVR